MNKIATEMPICDFNVAGHKHSMFINCQQHTIHKIFLHIHVYIGASVHKLRFPASQVCSGCMLWKGKNTHPCPRVAIISFNGAETACVRQTQFLNPSQV